MAKVIYVSMKGTVTSPGTLLRPEGSFRSTVNAVIENPGVLRKAPGYSTTAIDDGESTGEATQIWIDDGFVHAVRAGTKDTAVVAISQDRDTTAMAKATLVLLYSKEKDSTYGSSSLSVNSPVVVYDPAELEDDEVVELYRKIDANFPTGRLSTATFHNSIFFTTGKGVQRFDKETPGWIRRVGGLPNALPLRFMDWEDDFSAPDGGSTGGFLDYGYAVAYRAVWFFEYEDGRRVYGPPSSRTVIWNQDYAYQPPSIPLLAQTARNVQLILQVPYRPESFSDPLTSNNGEVGRYGCQMFRSRQTNLQDSIWPDDNMYLVNELYLDPAFLSAGSPSTIDFVDTTPDDGAFLGSQLYTNGANGGILSSNYGPENFHLLAEWRNRLWGANYCTKHRLELTMFALPVDGDSITVGEEEYYFKINPTVPTAQTQTVITNSFGIPGNVYFTMQALCSDINKNSTTLYAYLISSPGAATLESGAGATVAIEHRLFTTYSTVNDFTVQFSTDILAKKFRPYDSQTSLNTLYSRNEVTKDTLWCTKYGEPTSWPADDNYSVKLGNSNLEILAMRAIEDGLYVFTTKGLFVVTGRTVPFSVDLVDETFVLVGDECLTFAEGALWAWSTQGLAQIKNGRVQYVSGPIQDQLNQCVEDMHGKAVDVGSWPVQKSAFAFMSSDTTHGRVFLWLPKLSNFA